MRCYPRMKSEIYIGWLLIILLSVSCSYRKPATLFEQSVKPTLPDYTLLNNWAAHPDKEDPSDRVPGSVPTPKLQLADVFFVHPTTYTGDQKGQRQWNASVEDARLNEKTDRTSIRLQASAFNGAGTVWAPRYRQAHYHAFFTKDTASARQALELAYSDIRKAFSVFMKTRKDPDKPIIIAGHSQGCFHLKKLVREFFDSKEDSELLVAAYLIGSRVSLSPYQYLRPCKNATETGCLLGWRTFKKGFEPDWLDKEDENILVTNPLNWTDETVWVSEKENIGGVYTSMQVMKNWVGAGIHKTILWTDKPRFPGSFLLFSRNYHAGDINLFYLNIRQNAIDRANAWYDDKKEH